jgi:hypothetical protein
MGKRENPEGKKDKGAEEIGGFYHYVLVLVTDRDLRERIVKAYPPQRNR